MYFYYFFFCRTKICNHLILLVEFFKDAFLTSHQSLFYFFFFILEPYHFGQRVYRTLRFQMVASRYDIVEPCVTSPMIVLNLSLSVTVPWNQSAYKVLRVIFSFLFFSVFIIFFFLNSWSHSTTEKKRCIIEGLNSAASTCCLRRLVTMTKKKKKKERESKKQIQIQL